ncbi:MAG: flagellar export chaperone FlgN [Planctomycetota bacterium]
MNGTELSELVDERLNLVAQLVELTEQQSDAIEAGHMSQLMSVLSDKQGPLTQLSRLSQRLAAQAQADPEQREWASDADRQRCRERHDRCERMLLELVEQEKSCEERLTARQAEVQQELDKTHETGRALQSYASVSASYQNQPATSSGWASSPGGDSLDLSSE